MEVSLRFPLFILASFLVFVAIVRFVLRELFFSFFIGWKDYMPFVEIPSLWELV